MSMKFDLFEEDNFPKLVDTNTLKKLIFINYIIIMYYKNNLGKEF